MTPRKSKKAAPRAAKAPGAVEFVERPDAAMLVLRAPAVEVFSDHEASEFRGAYVKVMPTLRSSERSHFDAASVSAKLRELGATAVVIAPVIVPDGVAQRPEAPAEQRPRSAQQWLEQWFDNLTGAAPSLADAAETEALASAEEAGL